MATETIYTHFSSKADLLRRAIDIAVVGDDVPTPVAGRPGFAAIGQGLRSQRIAAAARRDRGPPAHGRVRQGAQEAAPIDEAIAEELLARASASASMSRPAPRCCSVDRRRPPSAMGCGRS